jgi:hypothetical protein
VAAERRRHAHLWLLLPAAAIASLWISWRCLSAVDFLYPVFYEALDIGAHIERFGPQNRYKAGFASTTREERLRLFGEIVRAIHRSGAGLAELRYHDPDGRPVDTLLRAPEIAHLEDVARLLDRIAPVGWLAVAWTLLHLGLVRLRRWPVPSATRMLGVSLAVTATAVLLVLLLGPRRVFYRLHEWVFPPENPWFFYYQDSLMSTMMKAPYLFGAIAAALLLLGLIVYAAILMAAGRLARR